MSVDSTGQNTYIRTSEQTTEEEVHFTVESVPSLASRSTTVSGEEKKWLVASLCKKFAIDVCKKVNLSEEVNSIGPDL